MGQKTVYQLSARQIVLLAFASALLAVGVVLFFNNVGGLSSAFQRNNEKVAFAEEPNKTISDPAAVSDEQNSIEIYKTKSPGVAFITTSSRVETFYGEEFERESGRSAAPDDR